MFKIFLITISSGLIFSQFSMGIRSNHYFSNEKSASNSSISFLIAQYIDFEPIGFNLELSHDHFVLPLQYRTLSQTGTDIVTSFFDVKGSFLSGSISVGYKLDHFLPLVGLSASYGSLNRVVEQENFSNRITDGKLELFYLFTFKYNEIAFIHKNLGVAVYFQIPIDVDETETREKLSYQSLHLAVYYEFN